MEKDRPATVVRESLRANTVRGPKKGTDEWYWRVRRRGDSTAGSDVWVGWGTRQEVVEKVNSLERGEAIKEVSMAGGGKWKKPDAVKTEGFIASVDRGPKAPVRGEPEWYWRIRSRGKDRARMWSGWATMTGIQVRLQGLKDQEAENEDNTKEKSVGLKVAIVSNMDHAKSVARALKDAGHTGFPFPKVKGRIPPSMDVILCRDRSTSHGAFDICNEERRRGNRPVVIENGVRRAVDAINAIAAGTWEEPNLVAGSAGEEEPEQTESVEDSSRQKRRDAASELIQTIVQKGGLFFPSLLHRTPSQARDALEAVPYPKKDRVVRTAVFRAFSDLAKEKETMVEAQFEALREDSPVQLLWWADRTEGLPEAKGQEVIIVRRELNGEQLTALAGALSYEGRTYSLEEPEITVEEEVVHDEPTPLTAEADHFPDDREEELEEAVASWGLGDLDVGSPVAEQAPEPGAAPEPEQEEAAGGDDPGPDVGAQERELVEFLAFVASQMDIMGLTRVPEGLLSRAGLCIEDVALSLSIVHLLTPGGAACGGAGTQSSLAPGKVNCKHCQATEMYEYAAWLAEQGGNDA